MNKATYWILFLVLHNAKAVTKGEYKKFSLCENMQNLDIILNRKMAFVVKQDLFEEQCVHQDNIRLYLFFNSFQKKQRCI